jgi:23S rRNA pseudouridine1911/1915/1917 synthase
MLHAMVLGFVHPATGEYMEIKAELPEYFTENLEKLGIGAGIEI